MRLRWIVICTLSACLFTALGLTAFAGIQVQPQQGQQGQYPQGQQQGQEPSQPPQVQPPPQQGRPAVSEDERKAVAAINAAADPKAKVQAGIEYLKKYGKSPMRPRLAAYLADEVAKVPDNVERVALAEVFAAAFNQPDEVDLVKPTVIDSFIKQSKFDEAFTEGAKFLARHPDDVALHTNLGIVGIEQAQRQNPKYMQVSQQYATKAIELMEADKKPGTMDVAGWQAYRTQWLPRLYQAQGVVLYLSSDHAGAKGKFEKAVGLDPQNPSTLMMLGMMADDEYQQIAKQYNVEKGPGKEALLKTAVAKMDEVIDWFARAVAASDGKPEFQAMNQQLRQNLEAYYKFRNNGSAEGMSKIIDKYKKPAGQ